MSEPIPMPCPWCGTSNVTMDARRRSNSWRHLARCRTPGCADGPDCGSRAEAVARWNAVASAVRERDALRDDLFAARQRIERHRKIASIISINCPCDDGGCETCKLTDEIYFEYATDPKTQAKETV